MSDELYRINPLVWRQSIAGEFRWISGIYEVFQYATNGKCYWGATNKTIEYCDSIEAGKLAAEAHYRARLCGPSGCLELVTTEKRK